MIDVRAYWLMLISTNLGWVAGTLLYHYFEAR